MVLAQNPRLNPAHVMGAQACSECHEQEVDAWRTTNHFKTFKELENNDKATEIADALDIDDLASESLCVECHFTMQKKGAALEAISGISCESCHGAAKGWIEEHNKETLPRPARMKAAIKGGMLPPSDIYAVAANCFDCHVVDREELVVKGGHPAFSENFDLYAWSQGEVRHSFMTPGDPVKKGGKVNREASVNHKRILFMAGKLLNLEYELRSVGAATANNAYAKAHVGQLLKVRKQVAALNKLAPTPEMTKIVEFANSWGGSMIKTKNAKALNEAGNKVGDMTREFLKNNDGSKLGAIDKLIPALHGTPFKP